MTTSDRGAIDVVLPNGDIVRVYDVRVETEMLTDPHTLVWQIMGKTSKKNDEWKYLGGYWSGKEYKLFKQLELFRGHFEYAVVTREVPKHHMIDW